MIGLALRQVPYENKAFWRNPAAAFFTFAFPILFLVIFTTLLGDDTATLPTGVEVDSSTYYTGINPRLRGRQCLLLEYRDDGHVLAGRGSA